MLATADRPVAAIDSVDGYDLWSSVGDPIEQDMYDTFERMGGMPSDTPALTQVRRATTQTEKLRQDLGGVGTFTSPVAYPNTDFAHQLAGLAAFIQFGLPIRVATIRAPGGYDTHSAQAGDLERNLRETCEALLAFQRDLEARGPRRRVLTEVWSEFGRRPEENGSRGTDHGAAGLAFVVGSRAQGQMVGEFPGSLHPRSAQESSRHQRLPVDVLLAARAVARPRCRRDHPGRVCLPPAPSWSGHEGALGRSRHALPRGCGDLAPTALAPAVGGPIGLEQASAQDCVWRKHSKRVVRWVRRDGRRRRVVRVRRWWRCHPIASPTVPVPAPAPVDPDPVFPDRLGVRADEFSYTLSRPSVAAGDVIIELDNRGEDPHRPRPRSDRDAGPAPDDCQRSGR